MPASHEVSEVDEDHDDASRALQGACQLVGKEEG
jgi:hypothetical protein